MAPLSIALSDMLAHVGAHSGAVYLLSPHAPVLVMAVMAGLPRSFAAPWERVSLNTPLPVADAVRERRLVWVAGEEEMANRYPRVAVVLPYPFALAALPVATPRAQYGAVFVTWPGAQAPRIGAQQCAVLKAACDRLARRLERAADEGRPLLPEQERAPASEAPPGSSTVEAARLLSRLPYGMCGLDLDGRVTYANSAACRLLGVPDHRLLGSTLWAALPWLNDPVYEDRYRAALVSQQDTSFVALRPPGDWVSFRLHPSTSGLSLRVTKARASVVPGGNGPRRVPGVSHLVTVSRVLALATALTEAVGVQDVIQLVADEVAAAAGCQAVVMTTAEGGRMHIIGHRGFADPSVLSPFDGIPLTTRTPGAHALSTGVPAFFESRQDMERLYPQRPPVADGMAAWAFLPLIASGRPVGTCVLCYVEPHVFPADERAVLTSLSGLIAQALERARLYDTKHQLAHGLQQALLPHSLPSLPGLEASGRYLPATRSMDIGGDFYDLIPAHGGAAAVIGDVEGHNVTAAALMGQVRTAVWAYTAVDQSPSEVMQSTNRLLFDFDAELFASCLYLRLDTENHRALFARAGHTQPLLRGPGHRVEVLDIAGGPPLGVDPHARYPTTELPLPPRSILVLYTDGLVEVPGIDLDDALAVVSHRLTRAGDRSLDEVADGLVRHLQDGSEERHDDVAVLLLRPV
ncbi:SpoIIE family protein phosphatase [Streptomyces sp. NPDC002004]